MEFSGCEVESPRKADTVSLWDEIVGFVFAAWNSGIVELGNVDQFRLARLMAVIATAIGFGGGSISSYATIRGPI